MEVGVWSKSSHSGQNGGDCVEVGAGWRKASLSSENGGACVEVAPVSQLIAVRDSKNPDEQMLAFSIPAFRAFTGALKAT